MVPTDYSNAMLQETQAQMLFKIKYVFNTHSRARAQVNIKL